MSVFVKILQTRFDQATKIKVLFRNGGDGGGGLQLQHGDDEQ